MINPFYSFCNYLNTILRRAKKIFPMISKVIDDNFDVIMEFFVESGKKDWAYELYTKWTEVILSHVL